MMLVAWCVAIPAYVVERTGIMGAFGRSAELTRGNRWRIFALFVLYVVALIIIEAISGMLGMAGSLAARGHFAVLEVMSVTPLVTVAAAVVGAVGAAVLYGERRRVRDGVGPQNLAAVFDENLSNLSARRWPNSIRVSSLDQTTRIVDRNGKLITSIYVENRTVVPLAQVAPVLQAATVSTEDRTFYTHQGVDYRRVAIARVYDATHRGSQIGGPTSASISASV